MKNLHVIGMLFISIILSSCSSDDTTNDPAGDPAFQATINGGTFSDYAFRLGVYAVTKGTNGNTLNISIADVNGNTIDILLNDTGGFGNGTVKQIGNVDSNNFVTNAVLRDLQAPVTYYSVSGTVKITNHRDNPDDAQKSLISGEFSVTASSIDGNNATTMTGTFIDLEYTN